MTSKVKVNDLHFQYQPRVSQDARLVQIWWFECKSMTSYRADKVELSIATAPVQWPDPYINRSYWKQTGEVLTCWLVNPIVWKENATYQYM